MYMVEKPLERIVAVVVAAVLGAGLALSAQEPAKLDTSLPALLVRLGTYIDTFEKDLATVVSEERYFQEVAPIHGMFGDKRELRSDMLLAKAGDMGWVAFRDVYEVDGKEVRDRTDRLVDLFIKPTGDSAAQVNKIVEASSRLNLGWVSRNINVPTMVLQYARTAEQHRSEFKRGGTLDVSGIEAREIRFQERKKPRFVETRDGAGASGKFWIEESSGRVLRTELKINTGSTSAVITVGYAEQPKLKLWLPFLMSERYSTPRQPVITGRATYDNFRRFDVAVETIIK